EAVPREGRQVQVDGRSRPQVQRLERWRGAEQVGIEVAAALGDEQATRLQKRRTQLDHDRQGAERARYGPVVHIAVLSLPSRCLGPLGDDLDARNAERSNSRA